ncbi:hypothetical protein FRC11_008744 [Ceratobasidium sp. 423]|nr:hypothetical protein FRC11_008744 [Ceratobasidium sp. 423]
MDMDLYIEQMKNDPQFQEYVRSNYWGSTTKSKPSGSSTGPTSKAQGDHRRAQWVCVIGKGVWEGKKCIPLPLLLPSLKLSPKPKLKPRREPQQGKDDDKEEWPCSKSKPPAKPEEESEEPIPLKNCHKHLPPADKEEQEESQTKDGNQVVKLYMMKVKLLATGSISTCIIIGNWYKIFALKEGWMTKTCDVNWAETAVVKLTVQYLIQQGYVGQVWIKLDSYTVLLAMSGGRVRVPKIIESACHMGDVLKISSFTIKRVKVPHKVNLADKFTSRKAMKEYKELEGNITIPEALAPFMKAP